MTRTETRGDYVVEVDGNGLALLRDPAGEPMDMRRIGLPDGLEDAVPYLMPGERVLPVALDAEGLGSLLERVASLAEERAEILAAVAVPAGYVIDHGWTGGGAYQDDGWWADLDEDDDRPCPWPGQVCQVRMLVADGPDRGRVVASGDAAGQSDAYGGGCAMFNVWVDEDRRRQGIATALYDAAGSLLGEPLRPYGGGNEGGAIVDFWEARGSDAPAP